MCMIEVLNSLLGLCFGTFLNHSRIHRKIGLQEVSIFFASYGRTIINPEEWILDKVDKRRLKKLSGMIKSKIFHNFFDSLKIKP